MRHLTLALAALLLNAPRDAADKDAIVSGNTRIAVDVYATLRGQDGNLFFSPYSVSTALAMTYAGAHGTTADQIARALRFSLPPARLHAGFATLMKEVNGDPERRPCHELYTANALWGQRGVTFQGDFLEISKEQYGGELNEVDFKTATEDARTPSTDGSRSRPTRRSRSSSARASSTTGCDWC
jgi:serine protease inhibitor